MSGFRSSEDFDADIKLIGQRHEKKAPEENVRGFIIIRED